MRGIPGGGTAVMHDSPLSPMTGGELDLLDGDAEAVQNGVQKAIDTANLIREQVMQQAALYITNIAMRQHAQTTLSLRG